jgi:hypothetical protein
MNRYCPDHGIVPATHRCRWPNGSTRQWRKDRAGILASTPNCWCGEPAVEIHHVTSTKLQAVCYQHNPRG